MVNGLREGGGKGGEREVMEGRGGQTQGGVRFHEREDRGRRR